MKLSVIMPVYNTRTYLNRAIDSILEQNLDKEEYELILIDDGSTDGSEIIAAEYDKKNENVKLINKPNGGEASARNCGLEVAKGKYITFVDCDDAVYENTLLEILTYLEKHDLDVLYLNMQAFTSEGMFIENIDPTGETNIISSGLKHDRRPYPATVYRRILVGKIRFSENVVVGTDTIFNVELQAFANAVSYYYLPFYKYTRRDNSLSKQGKGERAFQGFLNAISEIQKFQNENFYADPDAGNYFDKVYIIFVTRIIELNILPDFPREKYVKMMQHLEKHQLKYVLKFVKCKYPFIDHSFFRFRMHGKYIELKSKIHQLIYPNA